MKNQPEYQIQYTFVRSMALKYPDVLVFSDTAAHIKKTVVQQSRANKLSTGIKWPDVFIAQPSGDYSGLYLEFKAETPYKKDGVTLKKNDHIEAQAHAMQLLERKGYKCYFVWSVGQALDIVEKYFEP